MVVGEQIFSRKTEHERLMRLNTNVSSLQAQRAVGDHVKDMQSAQGKLSSGTRVRTASDDAASLSIGTQLKSKERSTMQAMRNTTDAISAFQVAEGSYNELSGMVSRLRELSIQAASDLVDDNQRQMIDYEYMQLRHEMERVAETTNFNGQHLLRVGANDPTRVFQVGVNAGSDSQLTTNAEDMTVNEFKLDLVDSHVRTKFDAQLNLDYLEKATEKLSSQRAYLGSIQNRLTHVNANLETDRINTASATSRIMDADMAYESANNFKSKMQMNSATSVLTQANNLGSSALTLLKKMP